MFTAALWKQPRCSPTDEWIKKLQNIYTIEYHSAIKRNAFESLIIRWTNLEPIIQSEVRKRNSNTVCVCVCVFVCIYIYIYIWNLERQ